MTKLERLMFAIGVKDEASSKVGKIQSTIASMTKRTQAGFRNIATTALGVVGVGFTLSRAVAPARELNQALAEVGALGVDHDGIQHLQEVAGRFAMNYGGTAAEVVRSSYDIVSAIDGLTGKEVAAFTTSSGLLAKASKSKVENMTSYMGIMYGIFEKNAERMGKAQWAEEVAAKTVWVANTFRSSGESVSKAFSSLGANAQVAGVHMNEQMAVLGMLQSTMGGAESGTKYKAFLAGVGQAQKHLGLSFTDTEGRMLGIVEILDKIKGKFGESLTVDDQALLTKAFGSKVATDFINLLLSKNDKLAETIEQVKDISDLTDAKNIARQTTDSFNRFGAALNYLQASMGQKMLPTLERWADAGREKLEVLNKWIDRYPHLASAIGTFLVYFIAFVGLLATGVILKSIMGIVAGLFKFRQAFKLISLGIRANPLGFLIWALITCIIYWYQISAVAGKFWNWLKNALGDTSWGAPFVAIMDVFEERWRAFTDLITDFSWAKLFRQIILTVLTPLEVLIRSIGEVLSFTGLDIGKKMAGFSVSELMDSHFPLENAAKQSGTDSVGTLASTSLSASHEINALASPKENKVPQKGYAPVFAGEYGRGSRKTANIGEQNFYFENPPADPEAFKQLAAIALN